MFVNETLKNHLETSSTVRLNSLVIAEWNMNLPDNIFKIGNYRFRQTDSNITYRNLPINFDPLDSGQFYTGATDADTVVDGGVTLDNTPQVFYQKNKQLKLFYSLEDCLKPFRPRSGINKASYFPNGSLSNFTTAALTLPTTAQYDAIRSKANGAFVQRPRYYMPSRYDQFKYWSSFRKELGIERGIANKIQNNLYYIDDAVPFVVYKNQVPANRLVVKMQTNVGDIDLGPFSNSSGITTNDPLYGDSNKTTPVRWKIQYLLNNNWIDAYSFNEASVREDGSPIIGSDGYVELHYGLVVPEKYKDILVFAETLPSASLLPEKNVNGYTYLIVENEGDIGTYYIWTDEADDYETFAPEYKWQIKDSSIDVRTNFVNDLTSPSYYNDDLTNQKTYREFQYINGIRVVVETMNKFDSTFDLIEMSPRLIVNLSNKVSEYSVTKALSDIGVTSLPVGQLLASTGQISLFDEDQAFNKNNSESIIANYVDRKIKFNFYEIVLGVDEYDYYIPIKSLYAEGLPQSDIAAGTISIDLRDMYFYLESMPAPRLLLTEISLSYAVSILLDYIGFSNYSFKRIADTPDPVIPYFFVAPDQNVAEVLNQLATSTQSAMFFDEYNNFIVMSKEYLMPSETDRDIDFKILGQPMINTTNGESYVYLGDIYSTDQLPSSYIDGAFLNRTNNKVYTWQTSSWSDTGDFSKILEPNILQVSSEDKKVFNDGKIVYTTRYIQRSTAKISQVSMTDEYRNWVYKPVLLWEVSGDEATKTVNEVAATQSNYSLSAMPLKTNLSASVPTVSNHQIINNTIDVGENIYWLTRYQGYLYSNGEIIKYDAAQFNITGQVNTTGIGVGNVWISSNTEYQKYFASLPFNGKIYPTGLLRIYSEPYYETVDGILRLQNGPVVAHGRGQFDTNITSHNAGLDSYWSSDSALRGCLMESSFLFNTSPTVELPSLTIGSAGVENGIARKSTRNGIIKNFMANKYLTENDVNNLTTAQSGTIQSSALVFNGPTFTAEQKPLNHISYVRKEMIENSYKHFGTRMRIIGKINNDPNRVQTPVGSTTYYQIPGDDPTKDVSIGGGSGGIAVLLNSSTNVGYYFEIVAMTADNITGYLGNANEDGTTERVIHNVVFYKMMKSGTTDLQRNSNLSGVYDGFTLTGATNGTLPISSGTVGKTISLNAQTDTEENGTYIIKSRGGSRSKWILERYGNAIPVKLWGGLASIIVDDGNFAGQHRLANEEKPTVYDLAVEYEDIGSIRRFYLYINNKIIQVVDDTKPLPIYPDMALFVRGSSRVMFENIYAISNRLSQDSSYNIDSSISKVFKDSINDVNESFRKYAISGVIQSSYMKGLSSFCPPIFDLFFDEFGTIMRECAYFDIRYDKAYPALYAKISPTINMLKGYTVSGFQADSYGAEFLVFNATDKAISLDETSGNYLRIQGVTFTQDTTYELSVDSYFKKKGNLSDPEFVGNTVAYSPLIEKEKYDLIRQSRMIYGKNEFSLETPYIQTYDDAENLMGWVINKVMTPKKAIGVNLFATPTLQLGDIVSLNYKNEDGLSLITGEDKRFVIYNIEYSRSNEGANMTVYLNEV